MRPLTPWRSRLTERVVLGAALVALASVLVERDWLWRWDQVAYDAGMRVWSRPAPDDLVIVAIDEASLTALGRWPWSRRLHADLVSRLTEAQARAIVLDLILAEPEDSDDGADLALAEAIGASARVVMPVLMEQPRIGGQAYEVLPLPDLASAAAGLGHVHVELDADGLARGVFLREGLGDARWPTIALATLALLEPARWVDLVTPRAPAGSPFVWVREQQVRIPFLGPPGSIPRVSYVQVLDGAVPAGAFRDKIVLVGATATGLGDVIPTPVSGQDRPMPGVEVHANALAMFREGLVIHDAPRWARLIVTALLALLPVLIYPRLPPRRALPFAVGLAAAIAAASFAAMVLGRLWFAPVPAIVTVTLSYPIWSWLRLEFAMRYLTAEIARLGVEQSRLPVARRPMLEPAVPLWKHLVNLGDWTLLDEQRTPVAGTGTPPDPLPDLAEGSWAHVGDTLWVAVHDGEKSWRLGVEWRGPSPSPAERMLLDDVVAHADRPVVTGGGRGALETIEARIGELQSAGETLRAMRRIVDDGLAQMVDGVLVVSGLGQVVLANQQAVHLLDQESLEATLAQPVTSLLEAIEPVGHTDWSGPLRTVLVERQPVRVDATDPYHRDLLVQLAPLRDERRRLAGFIANIADISALRQSERQRADMLQFLSHDLRSPLVSSLALIELEGARADTGAIADTLEKVGAHTRRTLELAEQFLALARAESLEPAGAEAMDLSAIAVAAIEQVWVQADAKRIDIDLDARVEEAPVRADRSSLERILVNLLTNAIKYSPDAAGITVEIDAMGNGYTCAVIDTGHGIAPEHLESMFVRYTRLRRDEHAGTPGVGLGLAFVKAATERLGGRVEVESAIGKGSTFRIWLPGAA